MRIKLPESLSGELKYFVGKGTNDSRCTVTQCPCNKIVIVMKLEASDFQAGGIQRCLIFKVITANHVIIFIDRSRI